MLLICYYPPCVDVRPSQPQILLLRHHYWNLLQIFIHFWVALPVTLPKIPPLKHTYQRICQAAHQVQPPCTQVMCDEVADCIAI